MKRNRTIEILEKLCFYFFVCALIGFIMESLYAFMLGNHEKRGFLYGPICPIYGFGAIILIILDDLISKKTNSIIIKMIIMAIVFTIFEYLVSLVFELIFGIRWWDYSDAFLNLQGRICLEFSILWGIGGGAFIQFLYKPLQKLVDKVKNKVSYHVIDSILIFLSIITLIDFILSIVKYLK